MSRLWLVARWLLSRLVPRADREFVLGDLDELTPGRVQRRGPARARWAYCRDLVASGMTRRFASIRGRPRSPSRRRGTGLTSIGLDVRNAFRSLRAQPALVLLSAAVLGIGIGSAGAVFGIIDQLVLRPVPGVVDDGAVAYLTFDAPDRPDAGVPWAQVAAVGESTRGVEALGGFRSLHATITSGEEPRQVNGAYVAGDYFRAMGVRPAVGRLLSKTESAPEAPPDVAVISESLWASQFARSPEVVGQRIEVNGGRLTVLGVAGGGFRGNDRAWPLDIWVPYSALSMFEGASIERVSSGLYPFQFFLVRGAKGVPLAALEAALSDRARMLASEDPAAGLTGVRASLSPGVEDPYSREYMRRPVPFLAALVLLVLMIPCANVANLLLNRGLHRRGDLAVRRAMGASRTRLARKLMIESVILAALGSVVGLGIAVFMAGAYAGQSLWGLPPFDGVSVDRSALAFASLAALSTAVVFGTMPALAAGRFDLASHLKSSGRQTTGTSRGLDFWLPALQFGLCVPLLVGGATLVLHLVKVTGRDLGLDVEGVFVAEVDALMIAADDQDGSRMAALYGNVLEAVRDVPGVQGAALVSPAPYAVTRPRIRFVVPGRSGDTVTAEGRWVSPEWFRVVGMDLLAGRTFDDPVLRRSGPLEVVVTAPLAERLFGGRDVLGRVVEAGFRTMERAEIVGVIGAVRTADPRSPPDEMAFLSSPRLGAEYRFGVTMRGGTETFPYDAVRRAMRAAAPNLPVPTAVPLSARVAERLAVPRTFARLGTTLGILALIVCGVGLYGVVAMTVGRRKREFGVRIAIGASPSDIARLVSGSAGSRIAAGIGLGLVGALWVSHLLRSQTFGVDTVPWGAYVASILLLSLTSLAASWAPSARAMRADPRQVLQSE